MACDRLRRRYEFSGALSRPAWFAWTAWALTMLEAEARIREDLLKEAQERLLTWYKDKDALQMPWYRDGATIQVSKHDGPCGDSSVPVTFGEFHVDGARPIDVFNALADYKQQLSWDPNVGSMKFLGDFRDNGVRGFEVVYPTFVPMVPSREVFWWTAYNATLASEEFWVAFSSQNNQKLHEKLPRTAGDVAMQMCLGAYHITRSANGAHVHYTQQMNAHPPFMISAKMAFDLSWGRTIDQWNGIRSQAAKISKTGSPMTQTPLPAWLLQDPPQPFPQPSLGIFGNTPQPDTGDEISFGTNASHLCINALFEESQPSRSIMTFKRVSSIQWALGASPFVCAFFIVAGLRRQRIRSLQRTAQLLPTCEPSQAPHVDSALM